MTDQFQRLKRDGLGWIADLFKGHEGRLKKLEGLSPDQLGGTQGRIVVVDQKADTAAADALTARADALEAASNALSAQTDALAAQAAALQAAIDAASAQQEIDLSRQVDPSNLFDFRPIFAAAGGDPDAASMFWCATKNPAWTDGGSEPFWRFDLAPNVTQWFSDGFTITAPYAGYEVHIGNAVPYLWRGDGSLAARLSYAYAGVWPASGDRPEARPMTWLRYQGQGAFQPIGQDSPSIYPPAYPASGAWASPFPYITGPATSPTPIVEWRPTLRLVMPNAGDSWRIRGLFVQSVTGQVDLPQGAVLGERLFGDDSILRRMLAVGAVGGDELANGVVSLSKLDNYLNARIPRAGLFSSDTVSGGATTAAPWVNVTSGTQIEMQVPTVTTTVKNTLSDGTAATITAGYVIAPYTGDYDVRAIARFAASTGGTVRAAGFRVGPTTTNLKFKVDRRAGGTFPAAPVSVDPQGFLTANAGDAIRVVVTHDAGSGVVVPVLLESLALKYIGP